MSPTENSSESSLENRKSVKETTLVADILSSRELYSSISKPIA